MTAKASIIVPTFQGVDRFPALLDSFANQNGPAEGFEVVVVVDGAHDGTAEFVAAESRMKITTIVFPENRGRVTALNAGFEAAEGDVLIRCDDDLVVPEHFVRSHVEAHEEAGSRGERVGVIGKTWDVHVPGPYAQAYGSNAARQSFEHASTRQPDQRWLLWAANCSITRDTWDAIGPYSTEYVGYGWEDVDYGYRLHKAGIPLIVAEGATAEHHGPARSAHARSSKAFDSGKARANFARLHPDSPLAGPSNPSGVWGRLVRTLAWQMESAGSAVPLPAVVDKVLPWVPAAVGRKLVALCVESAGLAGERTGRKRA